MEPPESGRFEMKLFKIQAIKDAQSWLRGSNGNPVAALREIRIQDEAICYSSRDLAAAKGVLEWACKPLEDDRRTKRASNILAWEAQSPTS
jgi:hypothetical protein